MKSSAVALLAAAYAQAQVIGNPFPPAAPAASRPAFHDIATTDDGGQTYFVSELRQKGTDQSLRSKIFIYADGTVHLFRDRPGAGDLPGGVLIPLPITPVTEYGITEPSVSGDGQMVAYTIVPEGCQTGVLCLPRPQIDTVNGLVLIRALVFGSARISGNKRYALFGSDQPTQTIPGRIGSLVFSGAPTFVDLATQETTQLLDYPIADPTPTDDGSLLVRDKDGKLLLWQAGKTTPVPTKFVPGYARVNRLATKVAYEQTANEYVLRVVDFSTGADVQIASAGPATPAMQWFDNAPLMKPSLTKDGRFVVYRGADNALWIAATDGSSKRKLADRADYEFVITGFGNYVYMAGRALTRINVSTGEVSKLIPDTPAVFNPPTTIVPGGNIAVFGSALDTAKAPLFGDEPGVVLGANDAQMRFLAPWDLLPGTRVRATIPSESPFETSFDAEVLRFAPEPFGTPVHENWTLITADSPAKPGEIIHMSLLNLGPVSPPVELGATVPVGTLHPTIVPLLCLATDATGRYGAEVLYSGLMPLANDNRYQVDLRLPPALVGPTAAITCADRQVAVVPVSR